MKPRQKVVTAQDVESSLYYFHVDVEEDEDVRNTMHSVEQAQQSQTEEEGHHQYIQRGRIGRKSLPSRSAMESQARYETFSKVYPRFEPPAQGLDVNMRVARKPVGNIDGLVSPMQISTKQPSPRKLHGPRPQNPRIQSVDSALLEAPKGKENMSPRRWSVQPPPLPARPSSGTSHAASGMYRPIIDQQSPTVPLDHSKRSQHDSSNSRRAGNSRRSNTSNTCTSASSITLIRRDPGSGGQWNIGSLGLKMRETEADVWVEITTPGYRKFVGENGDESDQPEKLSIRQGSVQDDLSRYTTDGRPGFRRQVFLDAHRSRSHPVTNIPNDSHTDTQHSHPTSPRLLVDNGFPTSPGPQSPKPSNAYTFRSPWNGVCEFSTGLSGRSLKCKHMLPSPALSSSRSLGHSELVSELRFNLPGNKAFGRPTSKRRISETFAPSKRSSALSPRQSHQHHRSSIDSGLPALKTEMHEDDSEDNVDGKMDLSLGQERAGGGSGGKRAKLGKLIITNEGLQMLDLIVAANMGMWWSVYEKERTLSST